jgi:hypothetical protein
LPKKGGYGTIYEVAAQMAVQMALLPKKAILTLLRNAS